MEEKEAIEIVEQFNKENRYRDGGKLNNAIDKVIEMAEKSILVEMTETSSGKLMQLECKLKYDIEKIEEKLLSDEFINDYRTVRLKAMRTKCKELLEFLGE